MLHFSTNRIGQTQLSMSDKRRNRLIKAYDSKDLLRAKPNGPRAHESYQDQCQLLRG